MKKGRRKRKSLVGLKIARDNKRNKRKYSSRYIKLINHIKLRDNWSCQHPHCKKPNSVKLTVHHIKRYADSKSLRNNRYNLISLCFICHKDVTGNEKKWESRFKVIARKNESIYKKNKRTRQQILEEQKKYQQLPDNFEQYQYKTDDEITKEKKKEAHLKHLHRLIKFRTQNKKSNSYKAYGGRGITMCNEWVNSYEMFEKYILENLGECPDGCSIDRIDNNKGYEPGNIRWAKVEEQAQNRRTTILDPSIVIVILILYYKYKFRICDIVDKLNLPNRTLVSGVINFKTWKNITYNYKKIIDNDKILKMIDEYNENNM